jgi:hypothetical protein
LFIVLANSKKQGPWEANSHLTIQEIPHISGGGITVCISPPVDHMNASHILTQYFCNIYFNMITLTFLFGTPAFVTTVILYIYLSPFSYILQVPHTSSSLISHPHNISWKLQIMKFPILQFSSATHYLHSPIQFKQPHNLFLNMYLVVLICKVVKLLNYTA